MSREKKRCIFVREDGTRCRTNFGVSENGYCWHHDPAKKEEREQARARGGKHAAKGRRPWAPEGEGPERGPKTAEEAREWSTWLVMATARGLVSEGVSQRTAVALNTFLRAFSAASMEREIDRLKTQVRELKRARR